MRNNKSNIVEGIEDEFQDLAGQLKDLDFSKRSNKSYVFNKTSKNIDNKGVNKMNKIKKTGIIAASFLVVSTLLSQTTFAQEAVDKIIKSISLGHVTMIQEENNDPEEVPVPDPMKGKIFDKNGKAIERFTKDTKRDEIYDKDGKQVTELTMNDGTVVNIKSKDRKLENILYVTDSSKLNEYTCFKVKLPTYLPDGYTFKNAEFTKDESGNVKDSKYASINFENKATGKEIYLQERFACEETKTVGDAGNIEKININGVDAILSDNKNIDWEADGTIYYLGGKNIGKDEAIKVAESIK
ncbi:DUF4367 domain-containing protein [Clostridium sp. C2-6-12]|uniref:DUF4367 domain-containing protein n=1 Tax=Clostridium sp. C2-6-12 TaxID=2698832 RepID=UPI0013704DD0|nr:DUF4367 domain-containing protein [Clostridium sp. C2-6-12]